MAQSILYQVEGIKNTITSQVSSFEEEVENFGLRWEQLKPRETSLLDGGPQLLIQSLDFLRGKRQEWNEIMKRKDKFMYVFQYLFLYLFGYQFTTLHLSCSEDCKVFNLQTPEFSACNLIEEDLQYHENLWSLYEEFNSGKMSFRRHL